MQIVEKKVSELIPYINNPRNNEEAVDAVMASIKEFGFKVPIVIDRDGVIIAGHTRLKASKRLGLETVPCVLADDLTEAQVKAFRLADNKVAEVSTWDASKLEIELESVDFDMVEFGFKQTNAFFETKDKDGDARQEGNEEYNEFLDKFEIAKTTDDCYTPDLVYDAVADYVAERYKVNKHNFVRPFYPGGDYQKYEYKSRDVVVDNPPFSILSEIVNFYIENGIKFFLFAPALTLFSGASQEVCALCAGVAITYENGAEVGTSFLTNFEDLRFRSCPELYDKVKEANEKNKAQNAKVLPKYEYPECVAKSTDIQYLSHHGVEFAVAKNESRRISALESQKKLGKAIFGSGYLISEKAAAEKAAAEKETAQKWALNDEELAIVRSLGA